jgi:MEKHLA domain
MIYTEMRYPAEDNSFLSDHVALMGNSYRMLLGKALMPGNPNNEKLAKALFYAPFVVVSHNTAADPVFNYANLKALELFGFSWEEFTRLPSRLSAEPIHQFERDKLLAEVSRKGYSDSYQGIRIARSGRRFLIKNAVVWNLLDYKGLYAGQAAHFEEWEFL